MLVTGSQLAIPYQDFLLSSQCPAQQSSNSAANTEFTNHHSGLTKL